jgi:hypothetical protein
VTEDRIAALEASLRSVTDQVGKLIDQVQQKGFVPAFRCGHSGLYLPADTAKEWGRKYGIGLGSDPVSPVLNTDYDTAPPDITPDIRRIDQIMHPVYVCRAQLDFVMVPSAKAFKANAAVLDSEDETMEERARIIRAKQLVNPQGRLKVMQAAWERH